jgi:glycosyltransferase involved in cell wall biosynthesis
VGITEATGQYIIFVDSDDLIDSNILNEMVRCNFSDDIISFSDQAVENIVSSDFEKYQLVWELIQKSGASGYSAGPYCKFFRNEFLSKYNILFNRSLYKGEDLLFNVEAVLAATTIRLIRKSFYKIQLSKNSITRSIDNNALNNSYNFMNVGVSLVRELPQYLSSISKDNVQKMEHMLLFNSYKNDIGYALRHQLPIHDINEYRDRCTAHFGPISSASPLVTTTMLEAFEIWMVDNRHQLLIKAYIYLTGWIIKLRQR